MPYFYKNLSKKRVFNYDNTGKKLSDVRKITNKDISEELSLPPVKIHCSVLAEDAIKAAIQDYENKSDNGTN